jgi:3-oxoacyl-[acyl-carrier-protein] synthase III
VQTVLPAAIRGTASVPAGEPLDNATLLARTALDWTPEQLFQRTGIRSRRFLPRGETLAGVAVEAVRGALADAGLEPAALRRLIFVNSTGGDFLVPATANAVIHGLGIADTCDAFDVNNACTGFLTGLDLAFRSVATGLAPTCVVAVEGLSRYLFPHNHRPYVVMGDAAGAAVLDRPRGGGGLLAASLGNDGSHLAAVYLGHPGLTGRVEEMTFNEPNAEIVASTTAALERCTARALGQAGLDMAGVDWVVPHQPNGVMLGHLAKRLGIPDGRILPVVEELGSPASASMAVGLDALRRSGRLRPGQVVLFLGVGAGMSYGALAYREDDTGGTAR